LSTTKIVFFSTIPPNVGPEKKNVYTPKAVPKKLEGA